MSAIESLRPFPPLHWTEKVLATVVWGAVVALFFFVGWQVLSPEDPQGAASLVIGGSLVVKTLSMWILAALVSGIVTILLGKRLSDAGLFTVCLGLGIANLQGNSVSYFLIHICGPDDSARGQLALAFLGESFLWAGMLLSGLLASGIAMRMRVRQDADRYLGSMAITDIPKLGNLAAKTPVRTKENIIGGLLSMLKIAAIALVIYRLLVVGSGQKVVHHQQVYFAIAASFWLAFWFTGRYWSKKPMETPFWGIAATLLVALIAYGWSAMKTGLPEAYQGLSHIPSTPYGRALPIEYLTIGPAAVIAAFWHIQRRNHLIDQLEKEIEKEKESKKK